MAFPVDNPHQITTFGMFVMQYINTINLVFFHISSKIGRGCRISVMASWTHFLAWEVPFFRPKFVGQINGFVSNWEHETPMEIAMLGVSDRGGLPKRVPGARHGLGGI